MRELPAVTLRGGLGNQLFQMAFLLSSHPSGNIYIDTSSAYANDSAFVDLLNFELPGRVKILGNPKLRNRVLRGINSRLLRAGLLVHRKNYLLPFLGALEILSSVFYSVHLRTLIRIRAAIGNGYDGRILKFNSARSLNIGFFQTYKWMTEISIKQELMSLKPKAMSDELLDLIELAEVMSPLIVHIRLGDYLDDASRGIPDTKYYQDGIALMTQRHHPREIWVFSDDEALARKHLLLEFSNVRWFSKVNNSDMQTFELMRHGCCYLIGNSTFSWWAATLCYNSRPEVVAPSPWFIASPIPQDLLWDEWKTLPTWIN
jgi:hypothetical protein